MKKTFLLKSILVLMVSVLITAVSSNSYAQRGPRPNDPKRDSAKFERGIPSLTIDQKTKIESLKVKYIKEITPIKNELAEKRAHLTTLESVEKTDKDAINKTIDEMTSLQAKIMKLGINHRIEVASLLNDEQKIAFNSHRGNHMGMGNGMGDGKGRGMKKGMHGNCPNCPNKN